MKNIMVSTVLLFLLPFSAISQDDSTCIMIGEPYSGTIYNKGLYVSSKGVIKALAIFIQFQGDNSYSESTVWPIDQPPTFLNTYLDSVTTQTSTPWSISHYYRESSLDSLRLIGKGYSVITQHPESFYRTTLALGDNAYGSAIKEVLQTLNSQINYSEYDNWRNTPYSHGSNDPDGVVDLIFVLFRNSIYPSGSSATGIATLGLNESDITLDGKTIAFSFPGSGITNSGGIHGMEGSLYSMKHELGHLFFGSGHPYYSNSNTNYNYWGIMSSSSHFIANAWERERLGWKNPITVTQDTTSTIPDFGTTGISYRIKIPSTNQEFIVENHQKLSIYDNPNFDRSGKGLYILHINNAHISHPTYDIELAEGNYNWLNPYWIADPFDSPYDSIPVFAKGLQNLSGYDGRDYPPHNKLGSVPLLPIFFVDNNGNPSHVNRYLGDPNDAFNVSYNQVFSPWSNPSGVQWNGTTSTNIGVEITGKSTGGNGEDIFNLKLYTTSPSNAAPAKPQNLVFTTNNQVTLNWTNNNEPDRQYWEVWRKYYRNKFDQQDWTLKSTPNTNSYTDPDFQLNSSGNLYSVSYKIRTKDTQGLYSLFSDVITTNAYQVYWKMDFIHNTDVPQEFLLSQNFPNPFNPVTKIHYGIPEPSNVVITVFDNLGREISTLINEHQKAGFYSATFDAGKLSSGIYFYTIRAGAFNATRRMLLLK